MFEPVVFVLEVTFMSLFKNAFAECSRKTGVKLIKLTTKSTSTNANITAFIGLYWLGHLITLSLVLE